MTEGRDLIIVTPLVSVDRVLLNPAGQMLLGYS
jgi:hypothetical protein